MSDLCVENIKMMDLIVFSHLVVIVHKKSAKDLFVKGINMIGVPKTIDNDVACTDITFMDIILLFKLRQMHLIDCILLQKLIIESWYWKLWVGLLVGSRLSPAISGGADALIPEIPYDINKVVDMINSRISEGKQFSVIVVSEGAKPSNGESSFMRLILIKGSGISTKFAGVLVWVAKVGELTGVRVEIQHLDICKRGGTICI